MSDVHPGAIASGDQIIQALQVTAQRILDGAEPIDVALREPLQTAYAPLFGDGLAAILASVAVTAMGHMFVATVMDVNAKLAARSSAASLN